MTDSRTAEKFVVRLPDGMRNRITDAAFASHRSMNAEIVSRLIRSFEADDIAAEQEVVISTLARRVAELEAIHG